jgi:hypothetical protein
MARDMKKRLTSLALVLAVVGALFLRAWLDGRAQLRQADEMAAAGDVDGEIRHLGRAARWRLPLAAHDEHARARLREIAERETEAGAVDTALAAWRELRSAILATRTVDVADPEQLAAANTAIVELMVAQANQSSSDGTAADSARWAAELEEEPTSRARSLAAAACFAVWLVACVGFFFQGVDGKGRLAPRPALRWGALALVSFAAWIITM